MKYSIAVLLIGLSTAFIACEKDDDNDTAGTNVIMPPAPSDTTATGDTSNVSDPDPSTSFEMMQDFQNKREALAGIITRHTCGICGQSGHPNFDNYLSQREDVTGISFNYNQSDPLYNAESREYVVITGLQGTPSFTVGFDNYRNSPSTWQTEIANFESNTTSAFLAMAANKENTEFDVEVKVAVTDAIANDPHLAIYVLENNIMSPQTDYSANPSLVQDYIHNHVYRGSASGLLGESIKDMWASGDTITKRYNVNASGVSNMDNAYLVAVLLELDNTGNPIGVINTQQLMK